MAIIESLSTTPPDILQTEQSERYQRALAYLDVFEHLSRQQTDPYIPDRSMLDKIDKLALGANLCLTGQIMINRLSASETEEPDDSPEQMTVIADEKPQEVKLLLMFRGMKVDNRDKAESAPAKRELSISIQTKDLRNEAYILGLDAEIQSPSENHPGKLTITVSRSCKNPPDQDGYTVYKNSSDKKGAGEKAWNSMILGKPAREWLESTGFFPAENELPDKISIPKITRIITRAVRTTIVNPEKEFIQPSMLNQRTRLRRKLKRFRQVIWRRKTD